MEVCQYRGFCGLIDRFSEFPGYSNITKNGVACKMVILNTGRSFLWCSKKCWCTILVLYLWSFSIKFKTLLTAELNVCNLYANWNVFKIFTWKKLWSIDLLYIVLEFNGFFIHVLISFHIVFGVYLALYYWIKRALKYSYCKTFTTWKMYLSYFFNSLYRNAVQLCKHLCTYKGFL